MEDNDDISDDGKSLWSNLLQDVKDKSSKTRQIPNSLLVLGNELSGKSSLIARLQKSDSKNGVGLEFEFIDVKDESMDENKQLNVWISSGDTFHSNLLKYALDENNFELSLCMITVSFSEPWAIIESLEQWLDILKKHIDRLKLDSGNLSSLKDSLSRHFQDYVEPVIDTIVPVSGGKRRDVDFNYLHPSITDDPDKVLVPLGEKVFDKNLGIPIIVVLTKTDQFSNLEQEYQYDDDKFDFIQMNVRKLCLKYGAALCYTSLKDGNNCELLLRYILHRCYGFPFVDTASVIEKEAIFIPTGWDNTNKINILADNLPEDIRNQMFDTFIAKPLSLVRATAQNRMSEPEMAEDEQVFLMRQQAQIQRLKAMANTDPNAKPETGRGGPLPKGTSVASSGPGRNRKNLAGQSSVATNPANPGAQGNEGVLANFFSSLLNKRGVVGGPPLQSQQSNASEQGKVMDSENEDSIKDDSRAEDIPGPLISNVEEKSSLAHTVNVEVGLEKLDEEILSESNEILNESDQKEVPEIDIDVTHDVTQITQSSNDDKQACKDDVEQISESSKPEEMEPDDENSTGKQISELDENVEVREESICELKMDVDNESVNENRDITEEHVISQLEDGDDNLISKKDSDEILNEDSIDNHDTEERVNLDLKNADHNEESNLNVQDQLFEEKLEEITVSNIDIIKDDLTDEYNEKPSEGDDLSLNDNIDNSIANIEETKDVSNISEEVIDEETEKNPIKSIEDTLSNLNAVRDPEEANEEQNEENKDNEVTLNLNKVDDVGSKMEDAEDVSKELHQDEDEEQMHRSEDDTILKDNIVQDSEQDTEEMEGKKDENECVLNIDKIDESGSKMDDTEEVSKELPQDEDKEQMHKSHEDIHVTDNIVQDSEQDTEEMEEKTEENKDVLNLDKVEGITSNVDDSEKVPLEEEEERVQEVTVSNEIGDVPLVEMKTDEEVKCSELNENIHEPIVDTEESIVEKIPNEYKQEIELSNISVTEDTAPDVEEVTSENIIDSNEKTEMIEQVESLKEVADVQVEDQVNNIVNKEAQQFDKFDVEPSVENIEHSDDQNEDLKGIGTNNGNEISVDDSKNVDDQEENV